MSNTPTLDPGALHTGTLRIGTRASKLALWQANTVAAALRALPQAPQVDIITISTSGDEDTQRPLSNVSDKGFFTKEIEQALLDNHIDLAVHSLKDLATTMPTGLCLASVLEREDPRDALIGPPGATLETLAQGARIGTSSLRRQALLAYHRPDLQVLELRGNVPTRIAKLDAGRYDAIILATAGLKRLGFANRITALLGAQDFVPAVGQGAVAIQIRTDDAVSARWARALNHGATHVAIRSERALLHALEGGCRMPMGALATLAGETILLKALVCSPDGSNHIAHSLSGPSAEPETLGEELAQILLQHGADTILAAVNIARTTA